MPFVEKKYYLKHSDALTVTRDARGSLSPESATTHETTVGEAIRNGEFATNNGTMTVCAYLADPQRLAEIEKALDGRYSLMLDQIDRRVYRDGEGCYLSYAIYKD